MVLLLRVQSLSLLKEGILHDELITRWRGILQIPIDINLSENESPRMSYRADLCRSSLGRSRALS